MQQLRVNDIRGNLWFYGGLFKHRSWRSQREYRLLHRRLEPSLSDSDTGSGIVYSRVANKNRSKIKVDTTWLRVIPGPLADESEVFANVPEWARCRRSACPIKRGGK